MAKNFILPTPPNPKGQAELIAKSFGLQFLKPKFFNVDENSIDIEQGSIIEAINDNQVGDIRDAKSRFGLPIFDRVRLESVKYTSNSGVPITVEAIELGTVLCEISQNRNIVTTQISGRDGTVKEYLSDDDFQISIKGLLISDNQNVAPKNQLGVLMGFCKSPVQIDVSCNFLSYFHIFSLVIESYTIRQLEGTRNMIPFELNCLSDVPIQVQSSNNKSVANSI